MAEYENAVWWMNGRRLRKCFGLVNKVDAHTHNVMPASIRAIAKIAGVSPAAVVYALSDSPKVSQKTRLSVKRIAEKLGYKRNVQASSVMRSFRQSHQPGSAGTIAVIYPSGTFDSIPIASGVHKLVPSIKARLKDLGFTADVYNLGGVRNDTAYLRRVFYSRNILGAIVLNAVHHLDRLPFDNTDIRTVAIGYSIDGDLRRVCPDQYGDMLLVLNKLVSLGYRRPALLMYEDLDQRTNFRFTAAYDVFYHRVLGLSAPKIYTGNCESLRFTKWLAKEKPDALLFEELSFHPMWVRAHVERAGLNVPRDVALVSIDVVQNTAEISLAGLSQNWHNLGIRAVEAIVGDIYSGRADSIMNDTVQSVELVSGKWVSGWSAPGKEPQRI
jgi:LacI family transcriptional regulator